MMTVRIENDDCLAAIPRLVAEGIVVDAVVTDPPYHLIQVSRGSSPRQNDPATPFGRTGSSGGFMGQQWDGGDVAFRPETWATIAGIMRPGAFLVAFGGTRTHHRLVCAIEDAGFVIQDTLMWLFATGFPKRRDGLKPAYEPICLAYKPGGARTMQVDECRIEADGIDIGRWPANICHDGSNEVVALFPASDGQQADVRGTEPSRPFFSRTGTRTPFQARRDREPSANRRYARRGSSDFSLLPGNRRPDAGSAARFFFSPKADAEDRWHSRHPTVKPVDLISWLVRLTTPPSGLFLDPFAGSGTAGAAAHTTGRRAILIERESTYVADIEERMAALRSEATRPSPLRQRRFRDSGDLLSIVGEEE